MVAGTLKLLAFVAVLLAIAGAYYLWANLQMRNASSDPRIFADATSELGVDPQAVRYFRIFGNDRVEFSTGSGVNFAYLQDGAWHRAGAPDMQAVPLCSELAGVPEQYREACYDEATQANRYTDAAGQNANYPASQMRVYK